MNKPPSCKLAWLSDKFVRYIIITELRIINQSVLSTAPEGRDY